MSNVGRVKIDKDGMDIEIKDYYYDWSWCVRSFVTHRCIECRGETWHNEFPSRSEARFSTSIHYTKPEMLDLVDQNAPESCRSLDDDITRGSGVHTRC
jgi:hypothetical protein